MQLHELKPKTPRRGKKIIGRGGKRGKTSGRGTKGQRARAGHRIRPAIRDVIKKLPKKRGYRFAAIGRKPALVKLSQLAKLTLPETLSPRWLQEQGLVKLVGGRLPKVKVVGPGPSLGRAGEFKQKIKSDGLLLSATAKKWFD